MCDKGTWIPHAPPLLHFHIQAKTYNMHHGPHGFHLVFKAIQLIVTLRSQTRSFISANRHQDAVHDQRTGDSRRYRQHRLGEPSQALPASPIPTGAVWRHHRSVDFLHLLCRLLDSDTDFFQACHQRRYNDKVQAVDLDLHYAHRRNLSVHHFQAGNYLSSYYYHLNLRR